MTNIEEYQKINEIIAQLFNHQNPLNYTGNIGLAWQALEKLQDLGYGFTIASLGRNMFRVRIAQWASVNKSYTSTGEYIINIMDVSAPLAICRAVIKTLDYNNAIVQ